ncbi:hypothetical protein [Aquibacillus salsiterrae]|uniref:Uncharacterized protein n=1 Tax=Aquibacillus salsiterrae TaxID=2950439 RepID=A0A9X3WAW3_9BACI|nr:hypothetical protein [Aquibacillus salsiterrae]MDC3415512.1 hypothetical protein [Aquibacillus salsiterrae]
MRKHLVYRKHITNQQGILLPYFMFILLVGLMSVTASISVYQNHLEITKLETEQLRLETLIQMAKAQFREEYPVSEQTKSYYYPYGKVSVSVQPNNLIVLRAITDQNSQLAIITDLIN